MNLNMLQLHIHEVLITLLQLTRIGMPYVYFLINNMFSYREDDKNNLYTHTSCMAYIGLNNTKSALFLFDVIRQINSIHGLM